MRTNGPDEIVRDDVAESPHPAFHDLLIATLPSLRQQALALTRHRADAEDLVQAAVTNALAAQHSFEPGTNFRAWMTRILRNRFFSNFRRRRETVDIDDAPSSLLGRSGGQEESIAMKELRANLARLPADQRLVLLMISVQGMSYDEASAQLGVAVGTLKCRVFRARRQLKLWMLGEDEEEAPARKREVRPARRASANRAERADEGLRLS
ncbi:sigma-70 family RNA polymerase sigma factor [Roseococcus sp. YIM B11640]|uniref:sigma-70 family RNA polymerase sigma factor n=1 Tax=Roseococcus sp. YIM B11640 TaxID=3133973 RepID=UPI003C7E6547